MKNARNKDILRTIGKEKKRFFSILLIVALGVTMLTGLRASCADLRLSADALFDEQKLFDIRISSTLGLDDEDVEALKGLDPAWIVEGEYSENLFTEVDGVHEEVTVRTLGEQMNIPTIVEGALPAADGEIAVTESYILDSGKGIGDTLTFTGADSGDEEPVFEETEYTITAVVVDPFDINSREGGVSFRSASAAAYTFFVLPSAADTDLYTAVYVYLNDTEDMMCYGDGYKQAVQSAENEINDTLKNERQQRRYDRVYAEAMEEYTEACNDVMDELSSAQREIDEAREELENARREAEDGLKELEEGRLALEEGQRAVDEGRAELAEGQTRLESGRAELEAREQETAALIAAGQAQIDAGYEELYAAEPELDAAAEQMAALEERLKDAEAALAAAKTETLSSIQAGIVMLEGQIGELEESVVSGESDDPDGDDIKLEELRQSLALLQESYDSAEAGFEEAEAELAVQWDALYVGTLAYEAGLAEWNEGMAELDAAQAELNAQAAEAEQQFGSAWADILSSEREMAEAERQLDDGQKEIDDGLQELGEGESELEEGQKEIDEGWEELNEGQQELDENREAALKELDDARAKIDDIAMAKWYIQSRDSLSGYSNVESDAGSIQSIGNFIPLIFFVVAILISLTAITRMVEEDRGLIGTYKALGFKNSEIRRKYMLYAAAAGVIGGIVGDFAGFIILPRIIFSFFRSMYMIPSYLIRFEPASGIIGIAMFTVGILLAALYAVHGELIQMPAALMRPSVPKGGTRIFLECLTVFWKRLSFLNKVTARNLFRYKKRLLMTVIGIMGCTGLLVCGFAIQNTVTDLEPNQYEDITRYDILAVATDNEKLLSYMDDTDNIDEYINIQVDSMRLRTMSGDEDSVQVFVIPGGGEVSDYIKLTDGSGDETGLPEEGIMITQSIELVFGPGEGDVVTLQDLSLNEADFTVAAVTENYLGDMVYLSEECYEETFGKEYEPNAVLIRLTESCRDGDPAAYAKDLGTKDGLLSISSTQEMQESFSDAFKIINIVVYVILVLAAALAFVVLFTLATTNISEREREVATIKVLGFYDSEVHMYMNKETVILSSIGIGLGLPVGWVISVFMCRALRIPGLYFAVSVHPVTYVICAATAVVFTLLVDQITNRILNGIDPAEALKSVE